MSQYLEFLRQKLEHKTLHFANANAAVADGNANTDARVSVHSYRGAKIYIRFLINTGFEINRASSKSAT